MNPSALSFRPVDEAGRSLNAVLTSLATEQDAHQATRLALDNAHTKIAELQDEVDKVTSQNKSLVACNHMLGGVVKNLQQKLPAKPLKPAISEIPDSKPSDPAQSSAVVANKGNIIYDVLQRQMQERSAKKLLEKSAALENAVVQDRVPSRAEAENQSGLGDQKLVGVSVGDSAAQDSSFPITDFIKALELRECGKGSGMEKNEHPDVHEEEDKYEAGRLTRVITPINKSSTESTGLLIQFSPCKELSASHDDIITWAPPRQPLSVDLSKFVPLIPATLPSHVQDKKHITKTGPMKEQTMEVSSS